MKNVHWLFFLIFMFSGVSTSAQYADDDVTIHSNRKARDPFKVKKRSRKIDSSSNVATFSLSDFGPDEKTYAGINISGIQIINAVSDSSLLGYVQVGPFNKWMEGITDKPYTEYLQSYVDRRYKPMYRKGTTKLVWVIQELRIGERTFNMSEKSFLHFKAMAFAGDTTDTFRLVKELDTILVKGGIDVTYKHEQNIVNALQALLDQSLTKNELIRRSDSPVYTMSAIREKAFQRYKVPALQAKEHADGIYLTFKEFINDQPSISEFDYSLEHNAVRFYHTDNNGNRIFIDKFWGVRKNGILLKQYYDLLIPIEQTQNGLTLTNYLSQARRNNNARLLPMMAGGLIGGAIMGASTEGTSMAGTLPLVENISYIGKKAPLATTVDIETGEFSL